MNRRLISLVVFCFFSAISVITMAQTDEQAPPEINGSWTIFSLPCTVDLTNNPDLSYFSDSVYSWNGSEYVKASIIERGVGYITDSKNNGHIKNLCSGRINSDDKLITYKQGWNLAGNPYKKAVNFDSMPGAPLKLPKYELYELRGKSFTSISKNPVIQPWQGYWLYIEKTLSITLAKDCYLDILPYPDSNKTTPTGWPVASPMRKVYLTAVEVCTGDDDFISRTDRNNKAVWSISGDNQNAISEDGVFTPFETGLSRISVSVDNMSVNDRELIVNSRCEVVLTAYSDLEATMELESGTNFSDFSPAYLRVNNRCFSGDESFVDERITKDIGWSINPLQDIMLDVETGKFTVSENGEYEIQGSFDGKTTNAFVISYGAPQCALSLQAFESYEMTEPLGEAFDSDGKTVFLSLNKSCVFDGEEVSSKRVSYGVEWNANKNDLAKIDETANTLTPQSSGKLVLSASYDGLTSNQIAISITMPACVVEISKFLNPERTLILEGSTIEKNQVAYFRAFRTCEAPDGSKASRDITKEVIWFMGPNGFGTLSGPDKNPNGPTFAPETTGLVYFWVKGKDFESAKTGIKVRIPTCSISAVAFKDAEKTTPVSDSDTIAVSSSIFLVGRNTCSVTDEPDQIEDISDKGSWVVNRDGDEILVKDNSFVAQSPGEYKVKFLTDSSETEEIAVTASSYECDRRIEMYRTTSPDVSVATPATSYGESIQFRAFEICYQNGTLASEADITDKAKWRASTSKYGSFDEETHTYTPSKSGSVGIYASINHEDIGKLVVTTVINECSYELRAYVEHGNLNSRLVPPFNTAYSPLYLEAYKNCSIDGTVKSKNISNAVSWNHTDADSKEGYSELWFTHEENSSVKYTVPSSSKTCNLKINAYSDEERTKEFFGPISLETEKAYFSLLDSCDSLKNEVHEEYLVTTDVNTRWFAGSGHENEINKFSGIFTPVPTENIGETEVFASYLGKDSSKKHVNILAVTCDFNLSSYSDSSMSIYAENVVTRSNRVFLKGTSICRYADEVVETFDVSRNIRCHSEDSDNSSYYDVNTGEFIPSGVGYGASTCTIGSASTEIKINLIESLNIKKHTGKLPIHFSIARYLMTNSKEKVNVYGFYKAPCHSNDSKCDDMLHIQDVTSFADITTDNRSTSEKGIIDSFGNSSFTVKLMLDNVVFSTLNFYRYNSIVYEATDHVAIYSKNSVYFDYFHVNEVLQIWPFYNTYYSPINNYSWEIGDTSIVNYEDGALIAKKPGVTWVRANWAGFRTQKYWIYVYGNNTWELLNLWVKKFIPIHINENTPYYVYKFKALKDDINPVCLYADSNIYESCDVKVEKISVNNEAVIKSDSTNLESLGGSLLPKAPGLYDVWAEYNNLKSNVLNVDFWNDQIMHVCEGAKNNSTEWKNRYSFKISLTLNCDTYYQGDNVYLQYDVNSYYDVYNHCLDLYILDDNHEIVKTLREESCGTESLSGGRSSGRKFYDTVEGWDMTDEEGNKVAPGQYYAVARFYVTYDPVIEVPFVIKPASSPEDEAAMDSF